MKHKGFVKLCAISTLAMASFGLHTHSFAQTNYPERAVTIVVGFAPGGSTDLLARALAKELTDEFKQSVIVENKPGANSNIANSYIARAKPDGYKLLMVPFGLAVNEHLYKNLAYSVNDFAPIALIAKVPNVLVINKKLPYKTITEFVQYAKSHPNELTYSSPGVGSSLHLAGELFRFETKAELLHIPFNGSGPALVAVRSGEVNAAFDNLPSSAAFIKSGELKALAVTSKERSPAFPNLPTVAESGFPNYEISSWFGLAAPAGTPPEIVDKLNKTAMKVLATPELQTRLAFLGATSEPNTPADFKNFIIRENKKWGTVIKASGIKPN